MSVCLWRWCIVAKRLDGSRWNLACRLVQRCTLYGNATHIANTTYWLYGTEVGLSLGDIVLDGDPSPPPLKGHNPQCSAYVYCDQTAGWIKMPLSTEVGLGPGDVCCVRWGRSSLPKGAQQPPSVFGPCLLSPIPDTAELLFGMPSSLVPITSCSLVNLRPMSHLRQSRATLTRENSRASTSQVSRI